MKLLQMVRFGPDGQPDVVVGDDQCNADPCVKHGTCHCMCVCGFDRDDCPDCADDEEETGEIVWQELGCITED
jgi:hypothetical protein